MSFHVPFKMSENSDPSNLKLKRRSNNWDPHKIANKIVLISISIGNILSFLKILSGVDPASVQFVRPENDNDFSEPWTNRIPVPTASFDIDVSTDDSNLMTKEQMVEVHRKRYEL